ncbi:F0F1 ATP synthase subunit A [Pseudactinotalea sp. Z1748]|uniref:F0F1 ATP synthase subunit A n=1 Tax=Pseudactinotalea sp. Z1748 TaxID=3413027 RepID=UPI003C7A86C1
MPLVAAADDPAEFHAPGMEEFFPEMIFGQPDGWFAFDRLMLVRLVVVAVLLLLLWLAVRRVTLVPGRGQAVVELLVDFVRLQIVEQIMGKERAKPFLPMLTVIFVTILAMNLASVIPFLNIGGTSRVGLPLVMAVWVLLTYLAAGVRAQGLGKYLRGQLFPPGIPWPMYFIITPIEILQVFILRPATLTLRLTVAMVAGHLMLVLAFAATHFLLLEASAGMTVFAPVTLFGGLFITVLEVFISVLQAFIFTILSAVYLNFALEDH